MADLVASLPSVPMIVAPVNIHVTAELKISTSAPQRWNGRS
jgi:hypothetical protein